MYASWYCWRYAPAGEGWFEPALSPDRPRHRPYGVETVTMKAIHHGQLFGVRRPLRVLSHRLGLDEDQVRVLADILSRLRNSRAQASLDRERSVADIADALETDDYDAERIGAALELRVESAARYRDDVIEALRRFHSVLRPEQRQELAYLLRSGAVTI